MTTVYIFKKVLFSLYITTVISCAYAPEQKQKKITFQSSTSGKEAKENVSIEWYLVNYHSKLMYHMQEKYNLKVPKLIKGTSGGLMLSNCAWILSLLVAGKITNPKEQKYLLKEVYKILRELKKVKKSYNYNDIWNVGIKDLDEELLPEVKSATSKIDRREKGLNLLLRNIASKYKDNENNKNLISKIIEKFREIEKIKIHPPKEPSWITKKRYEINANKMIFLIFMRGILAPNYWWWKLNDWFSKDKSGVKAYHKAKKIFGTPVATVGLFNDTINVVVDNNFAKQILEQSPDIFDVGKVKKQVFKNFMAKNVGISHGKEWYNRRQLNMEVLDTDKLHRYATLHNKYVIDIIEKYKNLNALPKKGEEFFKIAKEIVSLVIFNDPKGIPDYVFEMFKKANSIKAIVNDSYKIDSKLMRQTYEYFYKNMNHPKDKSIIDLAIKSDKIKHCPFKKEDPKQKCQKSEINHQIPHWIFPMMKQLYATIPRTMFLLANHPIIYKKVKDEIKGIKNIHDAKEIYNLKYLRACILETLRLNSVTITTLRRLSKDYCFDLNKKYCYKKGEQFLILNNPVLREPEKFKNPNEYNPDKWINDPDLEHSYYSIMFGQGPQRCPGKEIGIFLGQAFLVHYLRAINFNLHSKIKVDTNYIPQMINPFKIEFK